MKFNYTKRARKIALRHPLISDVGTQILFWIFAFLLYFILVNFISKAVTSLFSLESKVHLSENVVIALIGAAIFGTLLGLIDYYIERKLSHRSLGIEVLAKILFYTLTWFIVVNVTSLIGFALEAKFIDVDISQYKNTFFSNMEASSSIYTIVMILIISFIKQMNNKFGPGILLPMLLGKYRKPRVEERVFMFMDLKSSTSYAEKLGHIQYSRMIQNCFRDVNKVLPNYFAEVYQYVGDEVVLTWQKEEGLNNRNCINFYFGFCEQLNKNKHEYEKEFGLLPKFKASAHVGEITVAEVGNFKREIAYHGDTINIAARIQSVCNLYKKDFLISEDLKNCFNSETSFESIFVDETILKGKTKSIKIYSVE